MSLFGGISSGNPVNHRAVSQSIFYGPPAPKTYGCMLKRRIVKLCLRPTDLGTLGDEVLKSAVFNTLPGWFTPRLRFGNIPDTYGKKDLGFTLSWTLAQNQAPHLNLHMLPLRMHNGSTTWKSRLTVSYKIKHPLTVQPSNSTPTYLAKRNRNVFTQDLYTLYTNVHSSLIHSSPKVGNSPKPIITWWMNEWMRNIPHWNTTQQ